MSASTASASASTAASTSAAASTAAPGLLGLVVEALELLGVTGRGPCLDGILGGVGLHHGPHILARLLAGEDLDVRRQWRFWAIKNTSPSAMYGH